MTMTAVEQTGDQADAEAIKHSMSAFSLSLADLMYGSRVRVGRVGGTHRLVAIEPHDGSVVGQAPKTVQCASTKPSRRR